MRWVLLLSGILTNAGASLIMKRAMDDAATPMAALGSPFVWAGIVLYAAAFVSYAVSLTLFPLNVAHPILTCGAVAAVAAGSVTFYSETLRLSTLAGLVLVMAGVVLISQKAIG